LIVGSGFMEFISPGEKTMNLYLDSSQSQSIRARPTKVSSVSFCTSLHLHLYLQLSLSLHQSFHSCIFYLSISLSLSHNLSGPIISPSLYSPIPLSITPSLSTSLSVFLYHCLLCFTLQYTSISLISVNSFN
jgi:hypothetical protein